MLRDSVVELGVAIAQYGLRGAAECSGLFRSMRHKALWKVALSPEAYSERWHRPRARVNLMADDILKNRRATGLQERS